MKLRNREIDLVDFYINVRQAMTYRKPVEKSE